MIKRVCLAALLLTSTAIAASNEANLSVVERATAVIKKLPQEVEVMSLLVTTSEVRIQAQIATAQLAGFNKNAKKDWPGYKVSDRKIPGLTDRAMLTIAARMKNRWNAKAKLTKAHAKHLLSKNVDGWTFSMRGKKAVVIVAAKTVPRTEVMKAYDTLATGIPTDAVHRFTMRSIYGDKENINLNVAFSVQAEDIKLVKELQAAYKPAPPPKPTVTQGPRCKVFASEHKEDGINRVKFSTTVSEEYRTRMLTTAFTKLLQSAKATPHLVGKKMLGFQLSDILQESFFCKAGFVEGDVVTKLQGKSLVDVAATIQLLQTLRQAPKIEVEILRGKKAIKLDLQIAPPAKRKPATKPESKPTTKAKP